MEGDSSILSKFDSVVPAPLAQFDAFPKLPSTYKSRSEGRGFLTVFVCFITFLLMLNDIGEFLWGWPDYEFSVDSDRSSFMNVNVDLVVNMPCRYLSIDLRDALGDRLFLSNGLRRDGTKFDIGQATKLKEHSAMLSATQAISQSRKTRGFFSTILRPFTSSASGFKPTEPKYEHERHGSACRIFGTLEVKKVTANLHVTTLGHGYASHEHVDHKFMNLSHVISEFSFGPYFPDITQPLDYSFEVAKDPFVAYQYFLHVVPTKYIAPRSPSPLSTAQYSVTHYTRTLSHGHGTPGIFFKFDLDPMSLTIHQRTTTLLQLIIRCVGVIGGVFVCMGYAIRITTRAVEVVSGADESRNGIVGAAQTSGAKTGLRAKWGGQDLRSRAKVIRQGSGWTVEGDHTGGGGGGSGGGYGSNPGTPHTGGFATYSPMTPSFSASASAAASPYLAPGSGAPSPYFGGTNTAAGGGGFPASPSFASPSFASTGFGPSVPSTPNPTTPGFGPGSPSFGGVGVGGPGGGGGRSSRPTSMYGPPPARGHRTGSSSMSVSSLSAVMSPPLPPPSVGAGTGSGVGAGAGAGAGAGGVGSPSPANNSPALGSTASLGSDKKKDD
ncbi:DUF1692-domain-containing protein [Dendrothele bispora CBS 962.96]|uniref:DUF1692-domain-containing protein n=1 Tax=Dendrothele bispora (strain CBS 962.96) TaxID=1314807 RepID=A0A4S8M7S5_DENBC|nr:DUF1692-domain-containing protein [Dendrothele bispora CBS 962.96]